jgi:hypothetical protein
VELTTKIFLRDLKLLGYQMADNISYNQVMIPLTGEELEAHESATKCFLCDKELTDKLGENGFIPIKVIERCHKIENIGFLLKILGKYVCLKIFYIFQKNRSYTLQFKVYITTKNTYNVS